MPKKPKDPNVPRLKRDWEGRYVNLNREIMTRGGIIFEKGEVMKVTRNYRGLHLEAIKTCKHCSRRRKETVTEIPEYSVTLLPIEFKPEEKSS